jgi:hypothetical protein
MSRLVDPTICPDCRGDLDPNATCTVCGLQVRGPLAAQLWGVMVSADRLVEQLRAGAAPAQVAPTMGAKVPSAGLPHYPARATQRPPVRTRKLPSASVPVVLLSLGAVCLLVAATVFIAVTWSLMGLTGRTLVLLGFTAVLSLVAVTVTRRSLRGAAETFWLVVAGMLTVDLLAAQSAGLGGLDALSWRGTGAVVGTALLVLGVGVGAWARSQPVTRLYGAEAVAASGGAVLCVSNAWFAENPAIASTIAVPLLAGLFVVLRRLVPVAAYGLGGLAAATWLVLLGIGLDRAEEAARFTDWWSDARGWPLVVAAVLAAAVVHLPGVPDRARPVSAGLALLPLALLANAPQTDGLATRDLLVACGTLVALGLVTALAPRVWVLGAAALTALGSAVLGLWLLFAPWDVLTYLEPDGRTDVGRSMSAQVDNAASWSFLVAAVALVFAATCLLRPLPVGVRRDATQVVGTLAPAMLGLGVLVLVLELEPPLWAGVLAAGLAALAAGAAAWWSRDHLAAAVLGSGATAYLSVVTLYAASAADLLLALATTALFLLLATAGALREQAGPRPSSAVLAALAALVGGWATVAWTQELGGGAEARVLTLAVYAGLVGVAASPLARRVLTRVSLEVAAVVLAMLATGLSGDERIAAMVLTVVGTAVCVVAVTTSDRRLLGWAGALVLGVATVIRVAVGVQAPELYTLPAAGLLVAAGLWKLRTDRETSSFATLGSGLTLALLPSLLLALEEPVSLRGALIGIASVLVLGAGVQLRLAAPFVIGAVATGVLAIRHLEPVADAVPRWISLGGVGLVLLVVGVTWESRRRNLESAQHYLADLR